MFKSSIAVSSKNRNAWQRRIPFPGAAGYASDRSEAFQQIDYTSRTAAGGISEQGVRGKLLWNATNAIDVTLEGDYLNSETSASDASLIRRHGRQSALTTAGGAPPSPSRCANICAASRTTPCRIASGSPAQSVARPAMKVTSTRPAAPEAVTRTHPSPLPSMSTPSPPIGKAKTAPSPRRPVPPIIPLPDPPPPPSPSPPTSSPCPPP